MNLGRPLLEPREQLLEVARHVELVVDALELASIFVYVALEKFSDSVLLLAKHVFEEVYSGLDLVQNVQEKFVKVRDLSLLLPQIALELKVEVL